jgi:hypothetical protein
MAEILIPDLVSIACFEEEREKAKSWKKGYLQSHVGQGLLRPDTRPVPGDTAGGPDTVRHE